MVRNVILKIIILILIFQVVFVPISQASSLGEIINQGDVFLQEGANNQTVKITEENEEGEFVEKDKLDENGNPVKMLDKEEIQEAIDSVYSVLFTLGVALSVIIGAVLGIKFMIGSVEEQAKIKEMIIPYMLGCVVVFGAFGIWKIVIGLGGNVFN